MGERTCIVTRCTAEPEDLIRFVAGPDMSVVPDLKRNLPGRGCWVTAARARVDEAARKNIFRKALKTPVTADPDLGAQVDRLLVKAALGALGLARKAGIVALGAAKVDAAIRSGRALFALHAAEASEDGIRKLNQARRAVLLAGGPEIPAFRLFSEAEMSLAFGGANVIHAAVLGAETSAAAQRRVVALDRYRGGHPESRETVDGESARTASHKDTE
ncbi:RNA-binding protein [Nitratireductor alexandrii]|uniref:RNA-binding protein n=1 Tax=Nitratireductor alexandrii TaxID=2448161 RepID=UPI000FDC7D72|nr:RNA-binding protein [Nitratireductor alexandrii]